MRGLFHRWSSFGAGDFGEHSIRAPADGAQTMTGGGAITGNGAANFLSGSTGDDILTGGGGNDALNGGLGIDTANYAAASTSDSWHRNPDGSWTVAAGGEGTDTLTGMAFSHFTDRDVALHAAARTFSGAGTSDILFQRNDGVMADWNVSGTTITQAHFLPTAPSQWHVLGTGDLNGDGAADILWQRDDSLVHTWLMNNGTVSSAAPIAGVGAQWSYLGAGDFNGDGMADLAWQRSDGLVYVWRMNGATIAGSGGVSGIDPAWGII